jgi:hypothetical protein
MHPRLNLETLCQFFIRSAYLSSKQDLCYRYRSAQISAYLHMKFFFLALFITLGYGTAFAQTTVPANVLEGSPSFVDSNPRPTFYFRLAPVYRNFTSVLITWGTGSTKDGIVIKPSIAGGINSYIVTDIFKTGAVVIGDSRNDIYGGSYRQVDGRVSFMRSWDTGDSTNDVALMRSAPNSFQWEVRVGNTLYVGSYSRTFVQATALLENQGPVGPVGFLGIKQSLFSIWTARTVLPPKPRIENFQF